MILMITVGQLNAEEWGTKDATAFLLDKEYQLNIIMLYCSEKYETENMFKQCVINHGEAYMDIYKTIEFLYTVDQDGFDVSKPMECIFYALNQHWESEFNCANWVSVQKSVSICMDK